MTNLPSKSAPTPRPPLFRPTLNFIFVMTVAGLVLLLSGLFYIFFKGSQDSILDSSQRIRALASQQIANRIERFFHDAEDAVFDVEREMTFKTVAYEKPEDLEPALYAELLNHPNLTELAFTYGRPSPRGVDDNGYVLLEDSGRGSLLLQRINGGTQIETRRIFQIPEKFAAERRVRDASRPYSGGSAVPFSPEAQTPEDPTQHLTFKTTASTAVHGALIWSDLHPADAHSVHVTAQKAARDATGKLLGVLRVGLSTGELDAIVSEGVPNDRPGAEHRVFLCDNSGMLVTRFAPDDTLTETSDAFRFVSKKVPTAVEAALKLPILSSMGDGKNVEKSAFFSVDGREYCVTFHALGAAQDWVVGIVAPASVYLGGLVEARDELLKYSLLVMAGIVAGGVLTIRLVKRDLGMIVTETSRMRNFEFGASSVQPRIEDVHAVMDRLELAKTAMRSMSKYVPVLLVKQLYSMRVEPQLGSDMRDVSLMFTDVKDFTTISERLSPDELAHALGRYLQVMTAAIHAQHGTIDKFIGDAVMTFWNAPEPVANHSQLACQAALDCKLALERLFASPDWKGLPRFTTRFGLHRDSVMIGHFGAPDRMNYTAMGDGVNAASRLEGLNKLYGTSILVSETIQRETREFCSFRLIDAVAVKGRKRGIHVYELLGAANAAALRTEAIKDYEHAFELYQRQDFAGALVILNANREDLPSEILAERCRALQTNPPPVDWNGIYVAQSK